MSLRQPFPQRFGVRFLLGLFAWAALVYGLIAYFLLPWAWKEYFKHQPSLQTSPKVTHTVDGLPGDPINIALVGSDQEIRRALELEGWHAVAPIRIGSVSEMVGTLLLHRPDPNAPVSNLYLFGRKQDLAFEKEAAATVKKRHHVRLWRDHSQAVGGRHLWLGAATFDMGIEFSHRTGQVMHRVAPDIDEERDYLFQDLTKAKQLEKVFRVSGIGPSMDGRNGEGDWYFTDGDIEVGVVSPNNQLIIQPPQTLSDPILFQLKNQVWVGLKYGLNALQALGPEGVQR